MATLIPKSNLFQTKQDTRKPKPRPTTNLADIRISAMAIMRAPDPGAFQNMIECWWEKDPTSYAIVGGILLRHPDTTPITVTRPEVGSEEDTLP